jgi:prepilin-type processing-associated H-X9-DG protein
MNSAIDTKKVKKASKVIFFTEASSKTYKVSTSYYYTLSSAQHRQIDLRHGGRANMVFVDGHVEGMTRGAIGNNWPYFRTKGMVVLQNFIAFPL